MKKLMKSIGWTEIYPETAAVLKPRNYINLFLEYLYSVHIKHNKS